MQLLTLFIILLKINFQIILIIGDVIRHVEHFRIIHEDLFADHLLTSP